MRPLTILTLIGVFFSVDGSSQWTQFNTSNSGIPNNTVRSVLVDTINDGVWAGTDYGLSFFDGTNWTVYQTSNSNIPGNMIETVNIGPDDRVWVGTRTNGVGVFDGSSWVLINTTNSGLPDNEVNDIDFTSTGEIWFATGHGLAVYDSTTWQSWDVTNSNMWSNHALALDVNAQDHIYCGMLNGGMVIMNDTGMVVMTSYDAGLPDNTIRSVSIDFNGVAWCSTPSAGLIAIQPGYSWASFSADNTLMPTNGTTSIVVSGNDKYVTTINEGLVKFMSSTYIVYDSNNSGIPTDELLSVDKKTDVTWIGSSTAGLLRFDELLGTPSTEKKITPHFYPNPLSEAQVLHISGMNTKSIEVYSIQGKSLGDYGVRNGTVHLSDLDPGVYVLVSGDVSFRLIIR